MFFATIHRGNREEYKSFLQDVLKCHTRTREKDRWPTITITPTDEMYKEIRKDAGEFRHISEDFIPLFQGLTLRTFQELHIKKPLRGLVSTPA